VASHVLELPDLTHAVRVTVIPAGTREALTEAWKAWVEEAGAPLVRALLPPRGTASPARRLPPCTRALRQRAAAAPALHASPASLLTPALRAASHLETPLAVEASGNIPPGNAPGESKWQARSGRAAKPEIRLTAGKPITGITISDLIDQARRAPACCSAAACSRAPAARRTRAGRTRGALGARAPLKPEGSLVTNNNPTNPAMKPLGGGRWSRATGWWRL